MLEKFNTPEIQRIALIVGAIAAITYKNTYNIIPGGVIVPGVLLILFFISPIWCFTVIALSFLVFWIYNRYLQKASYKRRTPMYILAALSLGLGHPLSLLYIQFGIMAPTLNSFSGALIPAIIAFTWTRQKVKPVVQGIIVSSLTTAAIVLVIYGIGTQVLGIEFDTIKEMVRGKETLSIQYSLIQFYIMLAVGYWVYRRANIRSGGYVIAPAAAALLVQPISAVAFLSGCVLVASLTKAICEGSLIVGLNRYALALCLSAIYIWGVELIFLYVDSTILPFDGSSVLVIIAMLSFVNDSILHGAQNVYRYMGLNLLIAIAVAFTLEMVARLVI